MPPTDPAAMDLAGRVICVTGATDGLGRGVAAVLAGRGATVLACGRSAVRLAETAAELGALPGAAPERVRTYRADFASLAEVRALADAILAAEPRLDVLINNAGIGAADPGGGRRVESRDGYELRLAVNYLAPYLLTRRLLGRLEASAPARIVNVSSAGQAPLDFNDVMLERGYDGMRAYAQSKLAQILDTFELAGELDGSGVTVNALHPSTFMPTKMVTAMGRAGVDSLERGVRAVVRLAVDPSLDAVTGRYFVREREATPDPQASDPAARARLRDLSDRLTGDLGSGA